MHITQFVLENILSIFRDIVHCANNVQPFNYILSRIIIQGNILPSCSFYLFCKLPQSSDYVSTYVPLAHLRIKCSFQANQIMFF